MKFNFNYKIKPRKRNCVFGYYFAILCIIYIQTFIDELIVVNTICHIFNMQVCFIHHTDNNKP